MGKIILTYNDIIELNQIIRTENLSFKIHLHDACGSQSFTIEALEGNENEEQMKALKDLLKKFFDEKRGVIRFSENGLTFAVIG